MESPEQDRSQGALADSETWLIAPSSTDTSKKKQSQALPGGLAGGEMLVEQAPLAFAKLLVSEVALFNPHCPHTAGGSQREPRAGQRSGARAEPPVSELEPARG